MRNRKYGNVDENILTPDIKLKMSKIQLLGVTPVGFNSWAIVTLDNDTCKIFNTAKNKCITIKDVIDGPWIYENFIHVEYLTIAANAGIKSRHGKVEKDALFVKSKSTDVLARNTALYRVQSTTTSHIPKSDIMICKNAYNSMTFINYEGKRKKIHYYDVGIYSIPRIDRDESSGRYQLINIGYSGQRELIADIDKELKNLRVYNKIDYK